MPDHDSTPPGDGHPPDGHHDHGCDCYEECSVHIEALLECLCRCMKKKDKCLCANGEARWDQQATATQELLGDDTPVKFGDGGSLGTSLSGLEYGFDDDGGVPQRLRWLGTHDYQGPAVVKVDATFSVEREAVSVDQHFKMYFALGPGGGPLTAANVDQATRQVTDLQSDGEDTDLHIQGTFLMNVGDVVEVWVAKESNSAAQPMRFKPTGYTMTACALRKMHRPHPPGTP
jgi:hypothetical protein